MADDPQTEARTGGMIALVPTAEDAQRLAVDSGDDPDQLHLTLVYLGDDVTGWDENTVDQLTADLDQTTTDLGGPLAARVMGHALFNPDHGPNGDQDPCAVYLVGDTAKVGPLRDSVLEMLGRHELPVAEQHTPYLPHITGGYGIDPTVLAEAGPVTFDRLRLALGEQEIDVPLGEPFGELGEDEVEVKTADMSRPRRKRRQRRQPETKAGRPAGIEVKIASPDPRAARLRAYWAHGEGLRKWFRGVGIAGNFRRLRRQLAQYVQGERILNGLTANIFHEATGQWPGRRGNKSLQVAAEFKSLWDDDPEVVVDDTEAEMCAGIEEWGTEFHDRADDVADPDGDDPDTDPAETPVDAASATETAAVEAKAATSVGLVTIPAADLPELLFPDDDVIVPDELDEADRLMVDVDAAILAGDALVTADGEEEDGGEEWTEVAARDRQYQLGADAVLTPVDDDENRRLYADVHASHMMPR